LPPLALTSVFMKELLRSTDPTIMAFASALLEGEDIDCFQMDVNMSILEGGIGLFPRRMMVRVDDYDRAVIVMRDNEIPLGK
jgi:Putative prokaryotic signal transducing protein